MRIRIVILDNTFSNWRIFESPPDVLNTQTQMPFPYRWFPKWHGPPLFNKADPVILQVSQSFNDSERGHIRVKVDDYVCSNPWKKRRHLSWWHPHFLPALGPTCHTEFYLSIISAWKINDKRGQSWCQNLKHLSRGTEMRFGLFWRFACIRGDRNDICFILEVCLHSES